MNCSPDLVVSSQVSFRSCQMFFMYSEQENVLPIFVFEEAEEAKICWSPQTRRRTRSLVPSDPRSRSNQEEWLKELEDTSPANGTEGQTTPSASRTKLLENGRDSETCTTRESSGDADVDDVVL